ncbi:cytoplasmic tyrosine kinase, Dscr28C related (Drosophila), isoform CRA_d [Mus musculus]|nr:cytoplasmic tyrosine kinase, Dscr28C related (Drosophila), isoform CRA_d [Mus musculus]
MMVSFPVKINFHSRCPQSRDRWVKKLKEEIKNNNNIMIKYHPKFWADGSYQCCRQTEKLAPGCEKYNLFESKKASSTNSPRGRKY